MIGNARTTRRWLPFVLVGILVTGLAAALWPEPSLQIRPPSLQQKVEWVLEDWGVIPFDPSYHVED